jgi:Na+-driven multidrug efflux pump
MLVALYSTRVVLSQLGVVDFGVYNVVAGIVTMFSFVTGAMTSATQRFFSFEIGRGDFTQLKNVFNMSMNIHIIILVVVIFIAETVGLWFINNKIQIPIERLYSANIIYHCSIISFSFLFISIPYLSMIIAHEKMAFYAYVSIFDIALKLVGVLFLPYVNIDKLEVYSYIIMSVNIIIWCCYYRYSRANYSESRFSFYWDKDLFHMIFNYTGWSFIGNFSNIASIQGVNILLNIFFGPTANAARAISVTVNNAISGLVINLSLAISPQITKSYARDELDYMMCLIFLGSKYSFFLILIIGLPILYSTDYILSVWLGGGVANAVVFCQLTIIEAAIVSLSSTIMSAVQATGKIKNYQLIVGGIMMLNVPFSYIILDYGMPAESVYFISITISILAFILRMFFLNRIIKFNIKKYLIEVVFKSFLISAISMILISNVHFDFGSELNNFISMSFLSILICLLTIWILGLSSDEKKSLLKVINNRRL